MNICRNSFIILVLLFLAFIPTQLLAQPYNLYKVADTGTQMPNASATFGDTLSPVPFTSVESETFAANSGINDGIYSNFGGTLKVIANETTPVPGGSGNFLSFSRSVTLNDGEDIAFAAKSFGRMGVYTWIDGVFTLAADSSMNLPGVIGTAATFFHRPVSLGGSDLAFRVEGVGSDIGLYSYIGGTLMLMADTGTPIPGGTGNFTGFDFPIALGSGNVIFRGQGSGGQDGIYGFIDGALVVLADENTPIPGGVGNFTSFGQTPIGIGGDNIVFEAFGSSGQNGMYKIVDGTLTVVLDENMNYPGTTDPLTGFGNPVDLGGGDFAFVAISLIGGNNGIIVSIGGVISVAVDNTDPIPGGIGNFSNYNHLISLGGGDIAFENRGVPGQRGIYTVKSGVIELVADLNTPVPGGLGTFNSFSFIVSLGDGDLGFRGSGVDIGDGLYDFVGGTLSLVANTTTDVPENFGTIISFSDPQPVEGAKAISFTAVSLNVQGVYTHINFALGFAADNFSAIPGGNTPGALFRRFTDPVSIGNDNVAFLADGTDLELGFYSFISGILTLVADLNTPIPGGTGNFTDFPICTAGGGGGGGGGIVGVEDLTTESVENISRGEEPPLEPGNIVSPDNNGNLAFLAAGSAGQIGIYSSIGGALGVIADTSTPIPGGAGNFTNYTCVVSLGNGEVAFIGEGAGGQSGIYATVGGVPTLIADRNTTIPNTKGNYSTFGIPVSIDNGNIAFLGFGSGGEQGIYRSIAGVLTTVADLNTTIPGGGGSFSFFLDPISIAGGDITFRGFGSNNGIYTYIGGVLDVLVDTNTPIPGGTGNFTNFGNPAANPFGDIAFRGFGPSAQRGMYAVLAGNLITIADQNTPIPGGVGNFTQFNDDIVTLTGRDWAFRGIGVFEQVGIYNAILGTGSLTIVKETNPAGGTGFGFEGTGLDMQGCGLDGPFTLDDQGFVTCDLIPGSYVVQETLLVGDYTLAGIDCVGASSFSVVGDTLTVDLQSGETAVCTFTNIRKLVLGSIFPGIDDNINSITAERATPDGNVAFVWGFAAGSTIVSGKVCNGLELGVQGPKILAIVPAGSDGVATHVFYIPNFSDFEFQVHLQAIDITTCRESDVVPQIIRKDESG